MGHGHGNEHGTHVEHHPHLIPYEVYVKVLVTLLILTVITVAAAQFDFGNMNLVVAMIIASVKAGIVALFFMHLKYENPVVWLYVAFPLILLVIMIGGIFTDNPFRVDPRQAVPSAQDSQAAHTDASRQSHTSAQPSDGGH